MVGRGYITAVTKVKAQTAKSRNGKVERRPQGEVQTAWEGMRTASTGTCVQTFRTIGKTQHHPVGILRAEEAAQEHTGASTAYESLA